MPSCLVTEGLFVLQERVAGAAYKAAQAVSRGSGDAARR